MFEFGFRFSGWVLLPVKIRRDDLLDGALAIGGVELLVLVFATV